jgi:nucleoside-diphosphate-sugar epimerase
MPNILILGATGYIGLTLSTHLLRTGSHTVYGLSRSTASAALLAKNEIIPVHGDAADPSSYMPLIASAPIDIVIDCSAAYAHTSSILASVAGAGAARLAAYERSGIAGPRLGFIYVSGTWVHGSSTERTSDLRPVGSPLSAAQPPELVAWRPGVERAVLEMRAAVDVLVVRPGVVYGRANQIWGGVFGPLVEAAKAGVEEAVEVPIDPKARVGVVHVDDVAMGISAGVDAMARVAGTGAWPVFDLVAEVVSLRDAVERAGEVLGVKGEIKLVGPGDDLLAKAIGTSYNGTAGRARADLGWEPRRRMFVGEMDLQVKAFVAAQDK